MVRGATGHARRVAYTMTVTGRPGSLGRQARAAVALSAARRVRLIRHSPTQMTGSAWSARRPVQSSSITKYARATGAEP
jgi:hypothetical protein